jgi:hypothetical protein
MKSVITSQKIADLLIALDNPRFEPCKSQIEAYETIINELGDKFINIAEDIVDKGLNPSKVPLITKDENNPGKFYVCEGNRRVAVLKLLSGPTKIDEFNINEKFKKNYMISPNRQKVIYQLKSNVL